jgi:hypothetical protein
MKNRHLSHDVDYVDLREHLQTTHCVGYAHFDKISNTVLYEILSEIDSSLILSAHFFFFSIELFIPSFLVLLLPVHGARSRFFHISLYLML